MPLAIEPMPFPAPYSARASARIGKPSEEQQDPARDQGDGRRHGPDRVVMAAEGHLDDAGADLRGADQRAEGDGRRESEAPCLEEGEQVHRDHGGGHRPEGEDRGEERERAGPPGSGQRRRGGQPGLRAG